MGKRAEQQGYRVHAVYVRRVNQRYPRELDYAERSACLMGWRFTAVRPTVLPAAAMESVVKNQFAWRVGARRARLRARRRRFRQLCGG